MTLAFVAVFLASAALMSSLRRPPSPRPDLRDPRAEPPPNEVVRPAPVSSQ